MSQQDSVLAAKFGISGGMRIFGLFAFLSSPIWSTFIEAWLDQNKVFHDPNSLIARIVSGALAAINSEIAQFAAVFLSGALLTYVYFNLKSRQREDSPAGQGDDAIDEAKLAALGSILTAIKRVLDESDPASIANDPNSTVEALFEEQETNLDSLNVTLRKAGYSEIDFQNYNIHERDLLSRILGRLVPLLRDGHAAEALSLAQMLFKNANERLDRVDRSRPVRWLIEASGDIYCPNYSYSIPKDRIHEFTGDEGQRVYDWPLHLSYKTWFELGPFLDVFRQALETSEQGIDIDQYRRSAEQAERIFRLHH